MCGTQVSILGLLANDPATVPNGLPWTSCNLCNPNRVLFRDNKTFWYLVVPLNNFASMSDCPWVQGKSNKLPLPRCVCVGGGGGEGGGNSYSRILPLLQVSLIFINEMILYESLSKFVKILVRFKSYENR